MCAYSVKLSAGNGIEANPNEAAKLMLISANSGFELAMSYCGFNYRTGNGVPVDKKEAERYYKMAIDKGVVGAMTDYGQMLIEGDGID